jgi:hypothetical protein
MGENLLMPQMILVGQGDPEGHRLFLRLAANENV